MIAGQCGPNAGVHSQLARLAAEKKESAIRCLGSNVTPCYRPSLGGYLAARLLLSSVSVTNELLAELFDIKGFDTLSNRRRTGGPLRLAVDNQQPPRFFPDGGLQ
jgi:hypothetical protein